MKKSLLTLILCISILKMMIAQNVIKQCTPGAFYYSCGAAAAHQSEQGPWFDLVINGNQNNWYQGYGVESASWKELDNGTAILTARVYQIINKANVKFDMNLTFSNKGASTPHGGGDGWHCLPSNTSDWYYYRAASGTINGVAGTHVQGVTFTASLVGGSALQIGTGGSINSTTKYGMSAWLNLTQTGGWNTCWKKGGADIYFDLNNCNIIPPPNTCNNLTSGGTIGNNQSGCNPYTASNLDNITLPSGGDASKGIEYVWLKSTTYDGTAATTPTCDAATGATNLKGWIVIPGANGTTYNPGTVSQTTWYLRCSRRVGCPCYFGESNIVKITITGNCTTGGGTCPNLVTNGNFGQGFTGFQTEIRKNTWADCGNGGSINVVANTSEWGFQGCGDKDGNGKQLLVDFPAGDVWQKIWFQTVTVQPNTNYTFTFWASSANGTNPAKLFGMINNQTFQTLTLPTTVCQWVEYKAQWNSGSNTQATLIIKNNNAECTGNDFAIDAISFNCGGSVTPPTNTCQNFAVTSSNNGPTCQGGNIQLTANGSGSIVTTGGAGSELVTNGNLDGGNTGFTSELIYKAWDGGCDNYSVTSTPQADWKWPAACKDHTGNNGKMLIFDSPGGDAWKVYWRQKIAVQPNTTYTFSYWATSLFSGSPARLYSVINGTTSPLTTIGTTTCNWQQITFTWNSGSNTQADIMLKNDNGDCAGNDFAIDDISFKGPGTVTQPCTGGTYAWSGPNGYTSTQQNPLLTNAVAGTYTVVYTCGGCTATASTTVAVSPTATATIAGSLQVCNGSTTTLTAQGGGTYVWSNGSTASSITVGAGTYSVEVTNAAGCKATASATVTNSATATATIAGSLQVCNGSTTTLTAQGGGTYVWSNGSTASSITVGAGTYSVEVTNAAGCKATASATVTNSATATATIAGSLQVCNGSTTTLTAQGGGTYVWSNGSTASSITVGAGTYSVEVTNAAGCKATASATVTNSATATAAITGSLQVCNGSTTTLTAQGGGTYLWSNGSTASSITVGAGTYSVEVTNAAGCKATASATVTNSATATAAITGSLQVCNGSTTTLTAQGGGTYLWSNGSTASSITVGAGTYSVEVTNAAGCKATASATVTDVIFTTSITGETSICNGSTTTLTAQGGGTYLWSNGSTASSITVGVGTYSVEVTNAVGCKAVTVSITVTKIAGPQASITGNLATCNGGTTILTANGTGTYLWSNGATTQSVTVGAGAYSVIVTNVAGCTATASATVTNSTAVVTITGEPTVCQNATTTLTANGTGTYVWSNGATSQTITVGAGTYSVTLTSANGCTATKSITVTNKNCNTSSLGDKVFCDKNGNGVQDAGEPGIAGVVVTLSGAATQTTTTDTNGNYTFSNLPAGSYTVTFAKPNGYLPTGQDKGGNDATDSDANPATGQATVTLGQGENNSTVDAGFYQPSIIGNLVFDDKNNDGIQDSGELGLAGVSVMLTGIDGNGQTVLLSTTTDTNGNYTFGNLNPGTYTVMIIKPSGYNASPKDTGTNDSIDSDFDAQGKSNPITLASGTNNTTVDAGFNKPAPILGSLGDKVFCDKNGNGVQDAGEPGIAGVVVTLSGAATQTTTTDINGNYTFSNLPAGSYTVTFVKPNGYLPTGQDKGGNDGTDSDANPTTGQATVTLGQGENNSTVDAGFYQPSSIGNLVFDDKNNDGIQDSGELGLVGVTVMLVGTTGDGTPINLSTTTDANGNYTFANVAPGTYTVKFTKPTGYNGSPKDAGTNDATDSDADPLTGQTAPITITSGTTNTTVDAGFNKPAPVFGSIGDLIFCDKNANGIQDAGEPGLAGVSVMLAGVDGNGQTVLLSTITDANGKYNFGNLLAGTYTVMIIKPSNYNSSPKDVGTNDAIDSDFDAQGKSNSITLTAGQNINTIDAGLFQYASLGDLVFDDKNNDGIQDAGEPGIAGVTVVLNGIVNGIPVTQVTTTNANGIYKFINLLPGTYSVTFNKPTGFNPSPANQGTNDDKDSDANAAGTTQTVTLQAGDVNNSLDAGFNKPAPVLITIGDFVFLDCNKNGIQDANETGIANITVKLKDAAGTQVATTTTNASGAYSFANIVAGSYNVCFTLPSANGLSFSIKDAGTNDAKDSDVAANGETGLISFTTNNATIDAGIVDTQAPIINNVPQNTTVDCSAIPAVPTNITATDNYTIAPVITYTTSTLSSTTGKYLIKRTWTAVDNCGNKSTMNQTICVIDTQVPVFITKPADMTVECSNIPQPLYPSVKDNCDTKVPITLSVEIIPGSCPDNYTIKRIWTASDKAGNACTHAQYIKVQDTTAPVITGAPQDITIQCGQPIPTPPAPGIVKGTDNCDKDVTLTFSETIFPGNCAGKGVIKCQWTAVDNCGNVTIKIWTITIQGGASTLVQQTKNETEDATTMTRENSENVKFTNDDIKVFPNPTNGEVTILIGDVPATKLNIVNEMGQIIYAKDQPTRQERLNLSNGKKGLYTIQVITNDSVLTKKLIVIE